MKVPKFAIGSARHKQALSLILHVLTHQSVTSDPGVLIYVLLQVREVVHRYMQGLHWVMQYYYKGVPSWDWYFPYHYAPFLSDMSDLQTIQCEFDQGSPVLPLQQVCVFVK